MRQHFILYIIVFAAATSFKPGEKHYDSGKLILQFENYVGNDLLKLDSGVYKNDFGQTYTVSRFKYYVSNVSLKKKDGKSYPLPGYFIVNDEEQGSKQLTFDGIPDGEYISVSFILGVDSLHNCSGAQSGALDPANGMFWAWNTGYIFLKMDGRSPASASVANTLEYHVGGYKQPANCIRTVSLPFKNAALKIAAGAQPVVNIKTDLASMFKSPHRIDFSKISVVSDFRNATTFADNYAGMFSILRVEQ